MMRRLGPWSPAIFMSYLLLLWLVSGLYVELVSPWISKCLLGEKS